MEVDASQKSKAEENIDQEKQHYSDLQEKIVELEKEVKKYYLEIQTL